MKRKFLAVLIWGKTATHLFYSSILVLFIILVNFVYFSQVNLYSGIKPDSEISALADIEQDKTPKIAIVIDIPVYDTTVLESILSVDIDITLAVLPFQPETEQLLTMARNCKKEIIIDAALDSLKDRNLKDYLKTASSEAKYEKIQRVLLDSIETTKGAVGFKLHADNSVNSDQKLTDYILNLVKAIDIYIIDSSDTNDSAFASAALSKGILYYRSDFIVDVQDKYSIKNQLENACRSALANGKAIVTCHASTALKEALLEMIPVFDKKKIELVFVSEL